MIRRPPRSTRTYTLVPYPAIFRSGRHAGHIAAWAGIAGGATMTLSPEHPFDVEAVCEAIRQGHTTGKRLASIVVVSEGATPTEGSMELQSGEIDAFGYVDRKSTRLNSSH